MDILEQIPDENRKRIWQLANTIKELQDEKKESRLSWRLVAKRQEGSEELYFLVQAIAELPEAQKFFVHNERGVSLTTWGRILAQEAWPEEVAPVEQVADIVKRYAGWLRRLRFSVKSIAHIGKTHKRYVHAVEVQLGDTLIPNEAPVALEPIEKGPWINGRIVGQDAENDLLYISFDASISSWQLPAYLHVDRAFLLNRLADSLSKLKEVPPLGRILLEPDPSAKFSIANNDSKDVALRLADLPTPWARFLWGPPGAGKTYGMAYLMRQLIARHPGERILLVAPSNVAVDVALMQLVNQLENSGHGNIIRSRRILRFGYPRKPDILARAELLGSEQQEAVSSQIARLSNRIQAAAKQKDAPENELALLRAELLDLQEQLKNLVLEHTRQCLVVATTTTQAYMPTGPIGAQPWDTVLVDEVTMVPPAVCLYLSSLARKRFLLAGDPRQLGPVFEEHREDPDVKRWMGCDTYDFAALSIGEGEQRRIQISDKRLSRITSQRRCIPEIWQPIQRLYEGVSISVDESRIGVFRRFSPSRGQGIAVFDMARKNATCEKAYESWHNPESAQTSVELAEFILQDAAMMGLFEISVAIITPYRAQYKRLKQLIKERNLHQDIDAGTIHQFQGSEADVVIFDLVDGPGRSGLGKLLRGDAGVRLVNVAVSRARGKLIVLANPAWCQKSMQRVENPILWDVVVGK